MYDRIFSDVAGKYGLDPSLLSTFARIESGGNPGNRTGSYKGLFQLSDAEFARGGGTGNIFDPVANTEAAARVLKSKSDAFAKQYGRAPSPQELYMIHQQGEGGASTHWKNPNAPAWQNMYSTAEGRQKGPEWAKRAIWGNVPDDVKARYGSVDNLTSAEFTKLWEDKYNRLAGKASDPNAQVAAAIVGPQDTTRFQGQTAQAGQPTMALDDYVSDKDIDLQKQMAMAMLNDGRSTAPVGHWTQALARALQGAVGGYNLDLARQNERKALGAETASYQRQLEIMRPPVRQEAPQPAPAPQPQISSPGVAGQTPIYGGGQPQSAPVAPMQGPAIGLGALGASATPMPLGATGAVQSPPPPIGDVNAEISRAIASLTPQRPVSPFDERAPSGGWDDSIVQSTAAPVVPPEPPPALPQAQSVLKPGAPKPIPGVALGMPAAAAAWPDGSAYSPSGPAANPAAKLPPPPIVPDAEQRDRSIDEAMLREMINNRRIPADQKRAAINAFREKYSPENVLKAKLLGLQVKKAENDLVTPSMQFKDVPEGGKLVGIDPKTGEARVIAQGGAKVSPTDKKAAWDAEDELPGIDSTISALRRAKELNPKVNNGYTAGIRSSLGIGLEPILGKSDSAHATSEYQQIMNREAIEAMSRALKGATTDREMQNFINIIADVTQPPDLRERALDRLLNLAERQRQVKVQRLQELRGGQAPSVPNMQQDKPQVTRTQVIDGKTYDEVGGQWFLRD